MEQGMMKCLYLLSIVFFGVVNASQQDVAFLDITNQIVTPRKHQPKFISGSGGMAFGGDGAVVYEDRSLRITLLPLTRNTFQLGDEIIYEIKIENTGPQSKIIPWDPTIQDVEPAVPNQGYAYTQAIFSLRFTNENNLTEASEVSVLYGTETRKSSTLQLEPGQSVRIRAKARLSARGQKFFSCLPQCKVSVKVSVDFASAKVTVENGEYHEQMVSAGRPKLSVNTEQFNVVNSEK
jgi:hypothetical protein